MTLSTLATVIVGAVKSLLISLCTTFLVFLMGVLSSVPGSILIGAGLGGGGDGAGDGLYMES